MDLTNEHALLNADGMGVEPIDPPMSQEHATTEDAAPVGKKRAGYTKSKGQGTPKAKRRMVAASRRSNWRHRR